MTTTILVQWEAKPGRLEELLALCSEFKPLGDKTGIKNQRITRPMSGVGPTNLRLNYSGDFDDMAAYGRWAANAEFQALMAEWVAKAWGANAPGVQLGAFVVDDLAF